MPVPESSELKTVSVILTKDQVRRLNARKEMQSSKLRRVSFADVCREVVEVGLGALSHSQVIHNGASNKQTDARESDKEMALAS